ncbi:MAG: hypothetical protein KGO53_01910 [Alphaproteobacteria bacterium]|nr:hypothetical protein [Alphaproteobacteria bacterium]
MAAASTIYITASDQNRNGKTLLARLIADFLLLDGKDPFIIDTDAPEGPLRQFFPGRTALADFEKMQGRMKLFDTILEAPGRDYVVDLPQRHMQAFFHAARELEFFAAAHASGFRVFVFFIVDRTQASLRAAKGVFEEPGIDLFVAVKNEHVGSSWPPEEGALVLPALPRSVTNAIAEKRFSLRNFVLGDDQGMAGADKLALNQFLLGVLGGLSGLDVELSMAGLKRG